MNAVGYTYNSNDPEVMGFDTSYLESYRYSYKFFPNTFTMPNHNVIFMYTHLT